MRFDDRTSTGLGETRDSHLGGYKQNLVCTKTQSKGAVTPEEAEPDLPVNVGGSPMKVWVSSGSPWEWNTGSSSPGRGTFA